MLSLFRRNKLLLVALILYIGLQCFILSVTIKRITDVIRKKDVSFLSDFPPDCNDFAFETCVRVDLELDSCRGQRYTEPIVFNSTRGEIGYFLADCVENSTAGYDFAATAINPIYENCLF
jgi:hypothetical protein